MSVYVVLGISTAVLGAAGIVTGFLTRRRSTVAFGALYLLFAWILSMAQQPVRTYVLVLLPIGLLLGAFWFFTGPPFRTVKE